MAKALRFQATVTMLVSLFAGLMVPISRVVLGYHSGDQVLTGALVGVLFGMAWFGLLVSPPVQRVFDSITMHTFMGYLLQQRGNQAKSENGARRNGKAE